MSAKIIPIRADIASGDGWIGPKAADGWRLPDEYNGICAYTQSSEGCTCESCRPDLPPIRYSLEGSL